MEYVGTRHDPISLIPKVGIGRPTDLTMINGRIVWENGAFTQVDERQMAQDAEAALANLNT